MLVGFERCRSTDQGRSITTPGITRCDPVVVEDLRGHTEHLFDRPGPRPVLPAVFTMAMMGLPLADWVHFELGR